MRLLPAKSKSFPFAASVELYLGAIKAARSWTSAKARVLNPNHKKFKDYMGRGIKMCHGFQQLETFLAVLGPCDKGKSLDRKNNNGHYSCGQCYECRKNNWPLNCRWANHLEQCRNRRSNLYLTLNGITRSAAEWSSLTGLSAALISERRKSGWSDERILTTLERGRPPASKLSAPEALAIFNLAAGVRYKHNGKSKIARRFGVSHRTVNEIALGRTWDSVTGA